MDSQTDRWTDRQTGKHYCLEFDLERNSERRRGRKRKGIKTSLTRQKQGESSKMPRLPGASNNLRYDISRTGEMETWRTGKPRKKIIGKWR